MTWDEAFAVIERGGRVKREAWAGHFVLAVEPACVRDLGDDAHPHPLKGVVGAVHYAPYLLQVDTLTGEARQFRPEHADLAADDWHEVLT